MGLNSGLVCRKTAATIKPNAIYIAVVTAAAGVIEGSSTCPSAVLGKPRVGKYTVYYRSQNDTPIEIGSVSIGL
jgi:hypothetical protein